MRQPALLRDLGHPVGDCCHSCRLLLLLLQLLLAHQVILNHLLSHCCYQVHITRRGQLDTLQLPLLLLLGWLQRLGCQATPLWVRLCQAPSCTGRVLNEGQPREQRLHKRLWLLGVGLGELGTAHRSLHSQAAGRSNAVCLL